MRGLVCQNQCINHSYPVSMRYSLHSNLTTQSKVTSETSEHMSTSTNCTQKLSLNIAFWRELFLSDKCIHSWLLSGVLNVCSSLSINLSSIYCLWFMNSLVFHLVVSLPFAAIQPSVFVLVVWQRLFARTALSATPSVLSFRIWTIALLFLTYNRVDSHWLPTQGVQEGRLWRVYWMLD